MVKTNIKDVQIALSEINYIILNSEDKLQFKIPDKVKENISTNMDKNYVFNPKGELSPMGKAILSVIISKYIADKELIEKYREYDNFYYKLIEEEKVKKYKELHNNDIFFNTHKKEQDNNELIKLDNPINQLVEIKKESFFIKIKNFILKLFNINK